MVFIYFQDFFQYLKYLCASKINFVTQDFHYNM